MKTVFRALLFLSLASCAPCRSKGTPPVREGVHYHRVTIGNFGLERKIPLSGEEVEELVHLLADCRECVPQHPRGVMADPGLRYVVDFQTGRKPGTWDPEVAFSSDRSPLNLRCRHVETKAAIQRLLGKHMDALDKKARLGKPVY